MGVNKQAVLANSTAATGVPGFELTISQEWLTLGLIPWNRALSHIMEPYAERGPCSVILEGLRGLPISARADFANEAFMVRATHWMERDPARSYLVDVIAEDPLTLGFRPGLRYSKEEAGGEGEEEDSHEVFFQLLDGHDDRTSWLPIRQLALKLKARPGFESLLAPDVAREVTLFDYQLATVKRVLQEMRGRALLADEVGLGKTIEACMVLMEYILRGLVKSALILCPPSLVGQWREELERKFNWPFVTYEEEVFRKAEDPFSACPWLIASIDTLKRTEWSERVKESAYDLIIVDEAHHLKNDKTLAYRLVSTLPKKFILLLTATPVENRLDELFNLITLLSPGHLNTKSGFRRRFIESKDPLTPKHPEELRRLLRGVMIRNRRSTTGVIMTRRTAHTIEVLPSEREQQFYEAVSAFVRVQYRMAADAGTDGLNFNRMGLKTIQKELGSASVAVIPTLERMAQHPGLSSIQRDQLGQLVTIANDLADHHKLDRLLELLARVGDDKVLIFTGYRRTQDLILEKLKAEGISAEAFHGEMSRAAKDKAVIRFENEVPILVSTESGGEGRNLQFCHLMVNYDLPWNPLRIEQRIGRIHRIGQTKDVHIYNLVAQNTVESEVLNLLDAKLNMFQLVVGELDMILGKRSSERDFEDAIMDLLVESASHEQFRLKMEDWGEQYRRAKLAYDQVKAADSALFDELVNDA